MQATKAAFCFGGIHQHLRRWGLSSLKTSFIIDLVLTNYDARIAVLLPFNINSLFFHILHHGDNGVELIIMLLDEHGIAFFIQTSGKFVGNWEDGPLMSAQNRRDTIYTPGGLFIQTAAIMIATSSYRAIQTGVLLRFIFPV